MRRWIGGVIDAGVAIEGRGAILALTLVRHVTAQGQGIDCSRRARPMGRPGVFFVNKRYAGIARGVDVRPRLCRMCGATRDARVTRASSQRPESRQRACIAAQIHLFHKTGGRGGGTSARRHIITHRAAPPRNARMYKDSGFCATRTAHWLDIRDSAPPHSAPSQGARETATHPRSRSRQAQA